MAGNTVVGLFDTYSQAERAASDLASAGVGREHIEIAGNAQSMDATSSVGTAARRVEKDEDRSIGDRIGDFFRRLFGDDDADDDARHYSEAVRRGGALVTVHASNEDEADRAADILESCGAVDIDERASQWRDDGWAGTRAANRPADAAHAGTADQRVIPVVDEELQVGKRRRDRGGVRIYTHLTEQPVEEQVRLREEHARVERRPVDRAATEADFAAFKEGTIEVRESVEEPVVAKTARVVEEVVIAKETTERVETVKDIVRQGDVDIENLDQVRDREARDMKRSGRGDYDADYRKHWQSNYGSAGGAYDEYRSAYEYGSVLGSDERYRDRDWQELEGDARTGWESRYPNRPWDRVKAAVMHGRHRGTERR